ncbi:hypothetical protein D9M73_274380 [compost metagenome]
MPQRSGHPLQPVQALGLLHQPGAFQVALGHQKGVVQRRAVVAGQQRQARAAALGDPAGAGKGGLVIAGGIDDDEQMLEFHGACPRGGMLHCRPSLDPAT